jgi:general secretion pathway protein I
MTLRNNHIRKRCMARTGFTLLEVMVALAILAGGMVVMLQVQTRSIEMAQEAHFLTISSQLARAKLYDCETDLMKRGFSIGDYDEEGDFSEEGFETFFWECHAYPMDIPAPGSDDIASAGGDSDTDTSMGMGMIAPFMENLGNALKDSIRELVVVVRWKNENVMDEMRLTTHVIDKKAVNQFANVVRQLTSRFGGAMGGSSGGLSGGSGGLGNNNVSPGGRPGMPNPVIPNSVPRVNK